MRIDDELSDVDNETRQYVRDLLQYCNNYVTKSQTTRIEEVLTFDRLRVDESVSAALNDYRVFENGIKCHNKGVPMSRRLVSPLQLAASLSDIHWRGPTVFKKTDRRQGPPGHYALGRFPDYVADNSGRI